MKNPATHYVTGMDFRRLRQELGLSQVRAAALLGVDVTTLSRWESGETKRGVRRLYADQLRQAAAR